LNFSSVSFIPFDVSPAERGVDGCNGGQPVVALAYRPRAGARSFLSPMAWLFASSMRLLDPSKRIPHRTLHRLRHSRRAERLVVGDLRAYG
jgi:hypothetical protein